MPFYQNPFFQEFKGNLVLGDRQCNITYTCPLHAQRSCTEIISVALNNVYNLAAGQNDADGNPLKNLTINFAIDPTLTQFATIVVDISSKALTPENPPVPCPTVATALHMVNGLNANTQFASYFTAILRTKGKSSGTGDAYIMITSKLPAERIKFYVSNIGAETILKFNARAGVAELPSYFSRHTVAERFDFSDSVALLIELDPASGVDADVIDNAVDVRGQSKGFDHNVVQEDWELLNGRSGLFMFQKICLDAGGNIAQIIEYQAGAKVGDLARKICYYRASTTLGANPIQITEIPYVLTADDLIDPICTQCSSSSSSSSSSR